MTHVSAAHCANLPLALRVSFPKMRKSTVHLATKTNLPQGAASAKR